MLRVFAYTSAAGAKRYYTTDLAGADYQVRDWNVEGLWGGKGAELLGLAGSVQRPDFGRLCDNRMPDEDGSLTPRTKAFRRVGYDLVFDCPKSLSVLYALTGDERIVAVFREAVQETMLKVQAAAQTRVRLDGKNTDRTTGNLVWATFVHFTTRPVDGIPDPHLHAHVFVFNATHDPEEKRWKALQLDEIYRDVQFHEAVFHSIIAEKVMNLGYAVGPNGRSWRVESVPQSVVEKCSGRTAEINAKAKQLNIQSPERKAELGRQTRQEKTTAYSWSELHRIWDARLTAEERAAVKGAWRDAQPQKPPMTARMALELAHKECFERSGLVLENVLLESALRIGVGCVTLDELRDELPRLAILKRGGPGKLHFMDDARLRDEREVLSWVRDGRGTCRPFCSDDGPMRGVEEDEARAIRSLFSSTDLVSVMKVKADLGEVTRNALSSLGHPVTRFSGMPGAQFSPPPDKDPSDSPSSSNGAKRPVWWVDSSQQLGLPELVKLARAAEAHNARVVLAVDPGRISLNSPIRLIESQAGAAIRGNPGLKQYFAERREAARAKRSGRLGDAIKGIDRLGGVRELPRNELIDAAAKAYVASRHRSSLFWAEVNCEVLAARLNEAVRELLQSMKGLGRSRRFERLLPVLLTDKRAALTKGTVVIFSKPAKGFTVGKRYTIVGQDFFGNALVRVGARLKYLPTHLPDRFAAYRRRSIQIAKGDVIRITAPGYALAEPADADPLNSERTRFRFNQIAKAFGLRTPDRMYRVNKDSLHAVAGFTLGGHVKLENGWILPKDFGHWEYGYAMPESAGQFADAGTPWCAILHGRDGRGYWLDGLFTDNLEKLKAEVSGRDDDDIPTLNRQQREAERDREDERGFDYGH